MDILLVDSKPRGIARLIKFHFPSATVKVAQSAKAAVGQLRLGHFHLAVTAPHFAVVKQCRKMGVPVLVQTADSADLTRFAADAFVNIRGPEYRQVLATSIRALTEQSVDKAEQL